MFIPRTDLAIEAAAMATQNVKSPLEGVEQSEYTDGSVKVTKVKILNEKGERIIGKARGNYITIEYSTDELHSDDTANKIQSVFSKELTNLIEPHKHKVIFVAGLGNRYITPDALGPNVSDAIDVNRHLSAGKNVLCAVSPGVLGITGIETGEIIEGISLKIKPDIIIAIDALASRSMERICTTIQLADTGITPGAGVGNKRKELTLSTMGVPVIAIGVPTVVDAATVANDSVDLLFEALGNKLNIDDSILSDDNRYSLIRKILSPYFGDLIVTPSEIDSIIERVAGIIAGGINEMGHNLT